MKIKLLIICMLSVFVVSIARAADFEFKPSLSVSEEYDDNVFLSHDNRRSDYVTRLVPGIDLKYKAPVWEWNIRYAFDYRYYARGTVSDQKNHSLDAKGKIEIVKELLFLEVSDDYKLVSLDSTRDYTRESLFVNQSERNIFIANPYAVLRLSPLLTAKTGYRFTDTSYKEPTGIDKQGHTAYIDATYELSPKATANAGYSFTYEESDLYKLNKHDVYVGSRYEYAEGSYADLKIGNTWLDYRGANKTSSLFWSAMLTHNFNVLSTSLKVSREFQEEPTGSLMRVTNYSAEITKQVDRAKLLLTTFIREYQRTDGMSDTKGYGAKAGLAYEISPRSNLRMNATAERLKNELLDATINRYLSNIVLDYMLMKDLILTLEYSYIKSLSHKIITDDYTSNRVIAGLKFSF